jgi:hypothetical protein
MDLTAVRTRIWNIKPGTSQIPGFQQILWLIHDSPVRNILFARHYGVGREFISVALELSPICFHLYPPVVDNAHQQQQKARVLLVEPIAERLASFVNILWNWKRDLIDEAHRKSLEEGRPVFVPVRHIHLATTDDVIPRALY